MAGIVVVAALPTQGLEARQKLIGYLTAVMEYSRANEPGVTKYALCLPREDDGKTLYMVEEYADQAAMDAHMAAPKTQELVNALTTEPILAGAPTIHQLEFIDSVTKPEVSQQSDPWLVFATIDYKPGLAKDSLPYWKNVVAASRNDEAGTFVYGILQAKEASDALYTFEVYESKEYLWDVHAKSGAIAESVKNTKEWRTGLKHEFLKLIGGYLHKA